MKLTPRPEPSPANDLFAEARTTAAHHAAKEVLFRSFPLRRQLTQDVRRLNAAAARFQGASQAGEQIPPAAEWLVDNAYVVREQAQFTLRHFPAGYYRRLPVLTKGPDRGLTRIHSLSLALLDQTGGRCDPELLSGYLQAYQEISPLTMGELWAVPLFLRVVVVGKLRRIFDELVRQDEQRCEADAWLARLSPYLIRGGLEARDAAAAAANRIDLRRPVVLVYVAQRLREYEGESAPVLRWLESWAVNQGLLLSRLVDDEHSRQAHFRVTVEHLFTSLREIVGLPWEESFERLSAVEQVLRQDPVGVYPVTDFESRDQVRHLIEFLARKWNHPELDIARAALELARERVVELGATAEPAELKRRHVAHYLFPPGRTLLRRRLRRPPWSGLELRDVLTAHPNLVYFGGLTALLGFFLSALLHEVAALRLLSPTGLFLLGAVLLVPAGEWSGRILQWLLTGLLPPRRLLKLEFGPGLPEAARTMVVVPVMLYGAAEAEELAERLEVHRLANPGPNLHFALLADLPDAPEEERPEDAPIVAAARQALIALNARYPSDSGSTFYLLLRRRQWNPAEGAWMGWERKRGKLTEFNALLQGAKETSFTLIDGDQSIFPSVRYVITLDADTQLPRDAAVKLVGAIAHPLNAPIVSESLGRVVEGHGLLQPRVSVSHASTQRSWFAALLGGKTGLDVYTCAISDPYQELFQFGIYTGKGIYDVAVFDRLLRDRFPENAILSHDLLEGGFLRAGLVTDVELLDDYPATFLGSLARQHRWVRGDLQLLPWLLPRVADRCGRRQPVSLPMVTRWQMIDNWRRILVAPVTLGLLFFAAFLLPGRWPVFDWPVLAVVALTLLRWLDNLSRSLRQDHPFLARVAPAVLGLVFLPYTTWSMLDALFRTFYRLFVSRRHLLEWTTAARAGSLTPRTLRGTWQRLAPGGFLGLLGTLLLALWSPPAARLILPLSLLWLTAPLVAFALNRPVGVPRPSLSPRETRYLRELAHRTWRFFVTVVGPDDNWLPPDNLQLDPPNGVAHRTSPTNIGLYLASVTAARDLGYLTPGEAVERLERTVSTLERLPRWHGHFYNWYDTVTLVALEPRYISTVDSGNLVAYLLAVKAGLNDWLAGPYADDQTALGLLDAARPAAERKTAPWTIAQWYQSLSVPDGDALPPLGAERRRVALDELEHLFPWLPTLAALEGPDPGGAPLQMTLSLGRLLEWLRGVRSLNELVAGEMPDGAGWPLDSAGCAAEALETELRRLVVKSRDAVEAYRKRVRGLQERLEALAAAHDFRPLYNPLRRLFSIGYNASAGKLDPSHYDLMASEARQTSFVAIALEQVPTRHWFALNRTFSRVCFRPTLVSWSGTMFEYFMPLLLLPNPPKTLWDQTYRMVIHRQIAYAKERGLPWGMSESGFNAHDFHLNYQYQAFGVPGLGLKPGLGSDQVIAPYATFLAGVLEPQRAAANLHRLEGLGALGELGFYEAVDFTPGRVPDGAPCAVVKSHMAHHQGMILLSLANVLTGPRLSQRFFSDPRFKATEELLRERTPSRMVVLSQGPPAAAQRATLREDSVDLRYFQRADTVEPEARVLSNGRYLVMLSNGGGGFSQWDDLAVTRWREDPVRDGSGTYVYVRNLTTGTLWSPTHQPCRGNPEDCSMRSFLEKVVYERVDGSVQTATEICVSPEADAEIRQLTLTNRGDAACTLELTSYLEPVLSSPADDEAHPAFNRLFLETEAVPESQALLAHRRPRRPGARHVWAAHALVVEGRTLGPLEYETDRGRFVGRGRSARLPQAILTNQRLSGTIGTVLDPILCLRRRLELAPGEAARVWFVTGAGGSREGVLKILHQLQQPFQLTRAFEFAWIRSRMEIRYLNLSPRLANLFQWMASRLFYFNPYRRRRAEALARNTRGQAGLWAYGISGDLPLVLVRLANVEGLKLVTTMLRAHEYWRLKGLRTDLVILNDFQGSYEQSLQEALRHLLESSPDRDLIDRPGGVFLRSGLLLPEADQVLLEAVARISLRAEAGDLVSQLQLQPEILAQTAFAPGLALPDQPPVEATPVAPRPAAVHFTPPPDLFFFNGWGGFTSSGRTYVLHLEGNELPPAPWVNVMANPEFGSLVSEAGGGYTWSENSREHKLTPWSNDPVLDQLGEICYLKDEEEDALWSLTALPIREPEPYEVRHGQGYTVFRHDSHAIRQTGLVFVPPGAPVKVLRVTLENRSDRPRRLSVTYYAEWVLGVSKERTAPFIVTEWDHETATLLARNAYQDVFAGRRGFLHLGTDAPSAERSWTGDRVEFVGRNGTLHHPVGLDRPALSGHTGSLYHSCGAVKLTLSLKPRGRQTVYVLLGAARSADEARGLVREYGHPERLDLAFHEVRAAWEEVLGQVQVATPDPAFDVLMNRWLLYQTLSCRLWGRSAFYQSGGAYGFRDQLQDSLALLHTRPDLVRRQILLHAAHQYGEGDAQHWWHEETGYGIRTRMSDDRLWLPYAACRYVAHTGDQTIWDEVVPYLESEPLRVGEDERYEPTRVAEESGTLYDHCLRAIRVSLDVGAHGLPLIGTGDWNDALNAVGEEGRGESVWLGWFLYAVLREFAPVCIARGDLERAAAFQEKATDLARALEAQGWDGAWYRRAFTDAGQPLGSLQNAECQIDCIAQAWAVISGGAWRERSETAMLSLEDRLVDRDEGLISLLTPPFAETEPSPGYIQAYPKGVRENGGQYTHGAVWTVIAWARLGEGNRAYELFRLLNPVNHARTQSEALRYRVEPYVMAADVYSVPPYTGRGGWSWYTGAAGWMYQAGLEWLLGLRRRGDRLLLRPCIPESWQGFTVSYRFGQARYEIEVRNPSGRQSGATSLELDGAALDPREAAIPLLDDGRSHNVVLTL